MSHPLPSLSFLYGKELSEIGAGIQSLHPALTSAFFWSTAAFHLQKKVRVPRIFILGATKSKTSGR